MRKLFNSRFLAANADGDAFRLNLFRLGDGEGEHTVDIVGGDGIAVDGQGKILVGDASLVSSNNLYEVGPSGQVSVVYPSTYSPTDIHLDQAGNALVVERIGIKGVSRIARDGSWRTEVVRADDYGWIGHPTGIELDSQGNIYVAYRDNGTIYKIPPTGSPTLFAGIGDSDSVITLRLSPDEQFMYAANDQLGIIYRIPMESNPTATVFASGINRPHYMTFDNSGTLYFTAMGDDAIYKVVPEPATLTLLVLGGLTMLRRQRQTTL